MTTTARTAATLLAICGGLLPALGCGGGDGPSAPAPADTVAHAVTVSPAAVAFGALGSTRQLSADVRNAAGAVIPGRPVTWSLGGAGTTVSLTPAGLITSLAVGTGDTAVATAAGPTGPIVAAAPVTVVQMVGFILVTSPSATPDTLFTTGRQRQFTAAARDSNGNAMPGITFTWSSPGTGVAVVDGASGLATATGDGVTSINASGGGVTGGRTLVVRRFAAVFTLFPTSATLTTPGATQVFTAAVQDSSGASLPVSWVSRVAGVVTLSSASGSTTTATAAGGGVTRVVMAGGTRADSATVTVSLPVTFAASVQPIFTRSCATTFCHAGATPAGGLSLAAGAALGGLVGVAAVQFPGATRVIPGDAPNSYLVRKLENRNIVGAQMPDGGQPLSAFEIQIVRDWIAAGALNN